jgi:hypothetical protein
MIRAEILGPGDEVLSRVRLGGTWMVGTDRTCGLVLADPSVQPRHVEVREGPDGTVRLRSATDVGATRVGSLVLGGEAEATLPATVQVGEVAIRLSAEPADATSDASGEVAGDVPRQRSRPAVAWGLTLAVGLLFAGQEFLTTYGAHIWRETLGMLLGVFFVVPLWAGAWAIGNRLFGYRKRFHPHLATASLWGLVAFPAGLLTSSARELVRVDATSLLEGGVNVVLCGWLLYMHVRVAGRRRPRTDAAIAGGVVLAVLGLAMLPVDTEPDKPVSAELSELAPLPAGLFLAGPAERLTVRAERIFEDLDGMEADRSVRQAGDRP